MQITAFLNSKCELCTALSLLDEFGKVSGLPLNVSKSEGLQLGKFKNRQRKCNLFGIKWPEQIKCLGIYVGYSKENNVYKNWTEKIDKGEQILTGWEHYNLSLFGKIQVIKTFAISQLILPATLLQIPPNVIKRIQSILYRFYGVGEIKCNV